MNDNFMNDPYMMMMMMQHPQTNTSHMFNSMMGYNQFFMPNANTGYNITGNMSFLDKQYNNYDFGLLDYVTHNLLGLHRHIGMNGVDTQLAASAQHDLSMAHAGTYGLEMGLGALAMGLPMFPGLIIGAGVSVAADQVRENIDDRYKNFQKTALITSNFIGKDGSEGFDSDTIKEINKQIRDEAADDTMFSVDDIQEMMKKFNSHGFLNDVNSSRQYKDIIGTLKDRVRDLAEFLGETNPSKLLDGLTKYKSIGFTRAETFEIMKQIKGVSNISGISKEIIEQQIGMEVAQKDNVGTDERIITKRVLSEAAQINALSRSGFMPGAFSDKKKALSVYSSLNQAANEIMQSEQGMGQNQLMFLAMNLQKEKGGSLNKNYQKILDMDYSERNKLIAHFQQTNKEFASFFYDNDLLSTAIQNNKEVGSVEQYKNPIIQLIKHIKKEMPHADKNEILKALKYRGIRGEQLSMAGVLVQGYETYGNFNWLTSQNDSVKSNTDIRNAFNKYSLAREKTSTVAYIGRKWRHTTEWLGDMFGGDYGEEIAAEIQDMNRKITAYPKENKSFILRHKIADFKTKLGVKNIYKFLAKNYSDIMDISKEDPLKEKEDLFKDIQNNVLVRSGSIDATAAYKMAFKKKYKNDSSMSAIDYFKQVYGEKAKTYHMSPFTGMFHVFDSDYIKAMTADNVLTGDYISVFKKSNEFKHVKKSWGDIIKDKGNTGLEEMYLLERNTPKTKKKAKRLIQGYEYYNEFLEEKKENKDITFKDFLVKQRKIKNNKLVRSFVSNENEFKEIKNLGKNQVNKLYLAASKGNVSDFKELIKSPKMDLVTNQKVLDRLRANIKNSKTIDGEDKIEMIAEIDKTVAMRNVKFFTPKKIKELEDGGAIKFAVGLRTLNKEQRNKMLEAVKNNDTKTMLSIATDSGDGNLLQNTRQFVASYGGGDMAKVLKSGIGAARQKELGIVNDMKDLLNVKDDDVMQKVLSKMGDGDMYGAYSIVKKQQGNQNMSYEDFTRIQSLANVSSEFGFENKEDKKTLASTAHLTDKQTKQVTLALTKKQTSLLTEIKDILDKIEKK